jgi:hypothetical protein
MHGIYSYTPCLAFIHCRKLDLALAALAAPATHNCAAVEAPPAPRLSCCLHIQHLGHHLPPPCCSCCLHRTHRLSQLQRPAMGGAEQTALARKSRPPACS